MQRLNDKSLGVLLILTVALIWILASYVVQYLEKHTVSPFLITSVSNTLFLIFLPIVWIRRSLAKQYPWVWIQSYDVVSSEEEGEGEEKKKECMNDREVFYLALKIAPLWWCGLFFFNLSLDWTSVSSNTILSSTSSLFAFALSVFFLNESFFIYKLISLLLCFGGTVFIAFSESEDDEDAGDSPLLGDIVCVASAAFYASYTVLLKHQIPDTKEVDMCLLFGCMGLILFIGVSLLGLLAVATGVLTLNLSYTAAGMVVAKGLLDNVLSDFLWAKAVLLIGPTIATLGLSMQWPIAFIIDVLFLHPAWMDSTLCILLMCSGSFLIFLGFVGINLSDATGQALYSRLKSLSRFEKVEEFPQQSELSVNHEHNENET